jgi:hypothetical protein
MKRKPRPLKGFDHSLFMIIPFDSLTTEFLGDI